METVAISTPEDAGELLTLQRAAYVTEAREHSDGNLRLYARFGYRETHRTPTPGGYALVHLEKPLRIPVTETPD